MGSFYNNVVVKGLTQEQIVAYLREHQQHAFVSPTCNDITFVYDQEWGASAEVLSRTFGCVALIEAVYDSDVFSYRLYDHGQLIDEYTSLPDYGQEQTGSEEDEPVGPHQLEPEGGNARLFCRAFGIEHLTAQVDAMLHPPITGAITQHWLFAEDQQSAIAEALGWTPSAWWVGFEDLARVGVDAIIEGFDSGELVRTP